MRMASRFENVVVRVAGSVREDDLRDEFPASPARRAVVSVVRGYGAVLRLMSPYFAQFGISAPQFQMLTIINRLGRARVTQRELARELYVSFPNVTVMLSRLEEAGLIERTVNRADRREKFVRLTRQGKSLLRKIWKVHAGQLEHVMRGLDEDERRELARLLEKMMAAHVAEGNGREAEVETDAGRR